MTDLDRTFQDAIGAAAARTVTPPMELVAHRATARRVRRTAAVAVAAVAVVASAAIAVPKLTGANDAVRVRPTGHGPLLPYPELHGLAGQGAEPKYEQCLLGRAHDDDLAALTIDDQVACLAAAGYAPPAILTDLPPFCARTSTTVGVASGTADGHPWRYEIGAGSSRATCDWVSVDGSVRFGGSTIGAPDQSDNADELALLEARDWAWMLLTFRAGPDVTRATVTVGTATYHVEAVLVPSLATTFYALAVRLPPGAVRAVRRVEYDAAGRVVNRPPVRTIRRTY